MIRFDGLCVADEQEDASRDTYRYYLRFYEDGTVITCPCLDEGAPEHIAKRIGK